MEAIILAAGPSKRWESPVPKHLIELDGEVLLNRTIRQLKERGFTRIHLTVRNLDLFNAINGSDQGIIPFIPSDNFYQIDQFFSCHPIWRLPFADPVCFLYGDVYFSDYCIDKITESENYDFLYFQRTGKSSATGKPWKEGFAMKVWNREKFFMNLCQLRTNLVLGKIKNEHHQLQGHLEGKGMGEYWTIGPHGIEIDDETDDFDFFSDVARWTENVKLFRELQQKEKSCLQPPPTSVLD